MINKHIEPVFILGINPRSGTNYLNQLLTLHPDCVDSKHYGEAFIIYGAYEFEQFISKVSGKWASEWNNNPDDFRECIQNGIIDYLSPVETNARFVVTKTPDPSNAYLFLRMFSKGKLILITRKGQDLTESFLKTFKGRFDDAVRGWTNGAKSICKVLNDKKIMDSGRVICIKYEDLFIDNENVMRRIFDFLNLDTDKYDFSKSSNYDVIGSSTFKGDSDQVTWDPVKKTDEFNPLNRFAHWSVFRHYRFNWLAGKYSIQLGYELYHSSKNPLYYVYNFFSMIYDFTLRVFRRIYFNISGRKK